MHVKKDIHTANAFAQSWNNLPAGSVYTREQFLEWIAPLSAEDIKDKEVLELGCGNGSLMVHASECRPARLVGVDLGESVLSAEGNLRSTPFTHWQVIKDDLTTFNSSGFDVVYCIGVLHHLQDPRSGFVSIVRNTKSGGRFHGWVYAHEGNAVVRNFVEPLRKFSSRLPWWVTKYLIATPIVIPYFVYAKIIRALHRRLPLSFLPLYQYSLWIAKRDFLFFRHVAFDQLVTPQTTYIRRETIEEWLGSFKQIDPTSTYIIFRNGNSWKFGGRIKNE